MSSAVQTPTTDIGDAVRPAQRLAWIAAGVLLFALTIVLYWPATANDFVSLDDPNYAFDNREVKAGLTWQGVQWAFTTFRASNWHPLTWLSLMADVSLFGPEPYGFHAVNVVLHATAAALLFAALLAMTGAPWASLAVAALFAVHPLRVESVAWVSERKDVLSGCFWMTTLLAYTWYARRGGLGRYLLVCLSLALGLLSKPMLVTMPAVLLLLDWWPLRRLASTRPDRLARGSRRPPGTLTMGAALLEKLPLLLIVAGFVLATIAAQSSLGAVATLEKVPMTARILNAFAAYASYLWMSVWPLDLAVFYVHPALLPGDPTPALLERAVLGAALLAIGSALAVALAWRQPYLAVGWFWYLGTLVPVIGLVHVGQQSMADRYAYIPLIGIYIALVWAARDAALRWPRSRPLWAALLLAALAVCAVLTRRQIAVWRDSVSLFEHALAVTPDNYFAHTNLAAVLVAQGRDDAAAPHYDAALRIVPDYATALTGLGSIYFRQGRLEEAAELGLRALEREPDSAVILTNLGAIRFRQQRLDEAAIYFTRAVALAPDYAMAHANLGAIYFRQGQVDRAAEHFTRAAELNPNSAAAFTNLGLARMQQGRWADAVAALETALRLQPGNANIESNLAAARARVESLNH